jgi:hypothetical protein
MSVIQVVGSSRISNTTYLAVSSIYWTLILVITNVPLNLDIQTTLLLITPAGGIASILWVLRLEEVFVVRLMLFGFTRSQNGKFIRYHMGHLTLHTQPWKEAIDFEPLSVAGLLREEAKRVMRSPLLKNEMEALYHLFWLVFSIPALLVLFGISQQASMEVLLTLASLALVIDIILIFIIILRKQVWTFRVLGFAYCSWCTDLLRTISRRRESFSSSKNMYYPMKQPSYFPQRDSDADHFINRIGPWIDEMASLADREDWSGFERNLEIFLNSQDIFYKQENRLKLADSLVSDLIWSYKRQKVVGPYPEEAVTISYDQFHPLHHLGNTKLIVADALEETQILEPLHSKASWNTKEKKFLSDWDSLNTWEGIYEILPESILSELSYIVIQALAELPFFLDDPRFNLEELYQIRGPQRLWMVDLVIVLHKAVDRGFISPLIVFKASIRWNIMPKEYIEQCSPKIRPLILELETSIPPIELKYIARKVITDSPSIDTSKVASQGSSSIQSGKTTRNEGKGNSCESRHRGVLIE